MPLTDKDKDKIEIAVMSLATAAIVIYGKMKQRSETKDYDYKKVEIEIPYGCKNLKDFKITTKYDVNNITEISRGVLDLLYYVGENIQHYVEPEKIETMKANLEYMDEIFKYTEKSLKVSDSGTKEIKCTKNDVIKFIKQSKKIEVAVHNFQYDDLTKALGEYMKKYDNKKLKSEDDKVFVSLLKKVKKYFSKLSTGMGECAKISKAIEKEMKKTERKNK